MSSDSMRISDLVILDTEGVSNWIKRIEYRDAIGFIIYSDGVDAGTYTFEISPDPDATTPVVCTLQSGSPAADVTPPASDNGIVSFELPLAGAFRIRASVAVTGDQRWVVEKVANLQGWMR